jgi:hypothetical protein
MKILSPTYGGSALPVILRLRSAETGEILIAHSVVVAKVINVFVAERKVFPVCCSLGSLSLSVYCHVEAT